MIDYMPDFAVEVTAGVLQAPVAPGTAPWSRYVTQFISAGESPLDLMLADSYATPSSSESLRSERGVEATGKLPAKLLGAREPAKIASDEEAEAALLARRRATLIAVRNATQDPTVELLARLDILNARMRQKSPRVTEAHIATLEAAANLIEQVAERRRVRLAGRAAGL